MYKAWHIVDGSFLFLHQFAFKILLRAYNVLKSEPLLGAMITAFITDALNSLRMIITLVAVAIDTTARVFEALCYLAVLPQDAAFIFFLFFY